MKALKPVSRRRTVLEDAGFWTWAFVERLCEESERMAAHSADDALVLAELALSVAERAAVPEAWRPFLLGYSWAFIGNARRVKGNLPFADEAFRRAEELWQAGTSEGWPLHGSRLLDLRASLRTFQERFDDAITLLDQAAGYTSLPRARRRILLKKAVTFGVMGSHDQSMEILLQMETESQGQEDLFSLRFNRTVNLIYLSRYEEAQQLVRSIRDLALCLGKDLHLVRTLWLQGRIWAGLGQTNNALAALEQTLRDFTARQIAYDAALVSLEIAILRLERSQAAEVQVLAKSMAWIFDVQGMHVHALAAFGLFCQAAAKQAATADLALQVHNYLERARNNAQLQLHDGPSPEECTRERGGGL